MADVMLVHSLRRRQRNRQYRIHWRLQDKMDPFQLREKDFINKFRVCKSAAADLCRKLRGTLNEENGYSIEIQVLNTLRVLGTGTFQSVAADGFLANMHQSTVSRHMDRTINALLQMTQEYISFPSGNEISALKSQFYADLGFPNAVGAIDCTHVNIERPARADWFMFLDRKTHFSLNVQMVCDSRMKIMDVVARWPGSSHDSFIWRMSNLRGNFLRNIFPPKTFLLGDSGYPLEPWLMVPYATTESPRKQVFNVRQKKARNVIERTFGLLKSRFRCLHLSGGILQYAPEKVCKIILVTAILHNICLEYSDSLIEDYESEDDSDLEESDPEEEETSNLHLQGQSLRDEISIHLLANA